MRHRMVGCALAVLLGAGLVWPAQADAQRRAPGRSTRAVPAARAVPRSAHTRPYSYRAYRPYYSSVYWGWGYPWYPYPYFYGAFGYGYPYGHYGAYGPWGYGYPYYYYDGYASVRITGSPREAQVYVDGYFVGVVDDFDGTFQRLRVPPGGHEITLHLNGYRNASERMYLQPSSTYRLRTRLEPIAAGAAQDPPPAPNPAAVESDRPGERQPEGEQPPGPPSRRWPAREQAEQRQGEQAVQNSRFGTLTLRVHPGDAEVVIDGAPWRGDAQEEGVLSIQVAAGTHRVEIRREGFASYVADVNVRANASTPLNVMLQREGGT